MSEFIECYKLLDSVTVDQWRRDGREAHIGAPDERPNERDEPESHKTHRTRHSTPRRAGTSTAAHLPRIEPRQRPARAHAANEAE